MKPKLQPSQRTSNAEMSAQTRAKILTATIESLAQRGYAGTNMAEIAKRVGLTRAALIYHFDSKHVLMSAVINAIYDEMLAKYFLATPATLSPAQCVLALFDASYDMASTTNQVAMIELLLAARRDPDYGAIVATEIQRREDGFQNQWNALVERLPGQGKSLRVLRDLGVALLRGMTVSHSIAGHDPTLKLQYAIMRQLVSDALLKQSTS